MVRRRKGSIQELLVERERVWLPSGPYNTVLLLFGLLVALPGTWAAGIELTRDARWAALFVVAALTAIGLGRRAWYRREVPVAWSVDKGAGTVTIEGRVLPARAAVHVITWKPPLSAHGDTLPDALPASFPGARCLGVIQHIEPAEPGRQRGAIAWIYWSTQADTVDALARALAGALGIGLEIR